MATTYYYSRDAQRFGPVSAEQLRELAVAGQLHPTDLIWKEGMADWVPAARLKGLFPAATAQPVAAPQPATAWQTAPAPQAANHGDEFRMAEAAPRPRPVEAEIPIPSRPPKQSEPESQVDEWVRASKRHAKAIFGDLRAMNFKQEVVPIDSTNASAMAKDKVFWAAMLLGIVPLFIGTFERFDVQVTAFAFFFAAVWGAIFKFFVVGYRGSWKLPVSALLFTAIAGIAVYGFFAKHILPQFYVEMPASENLFVSLLGFVFQVGVCEEFCKIVPVIAFVLWKRKTAEPLEVVIIGVFSGLGFAATENLHYSDLIGAAVQKVAMAHGGVGVAFGAQFAMVLIMLRSVSLVFVHAVFCGIFSYFLAIAAQSRQRWGALFLVGLGIAATLHGGYDWLATIHPVLSTLVAATAFVLFYGYLAKLKMAIAAPDNVLPITNTGIAPPVST